MLVGDNRPAANSFGREQVEREGAFPNPDVGEFLRVGDDGPHYLLAGHVPSACTMRCRLWPPSGRE